MAADPNPGDARAVTLDDGVVLELVWIPPGTFTMGSETAENRGETDEMPPHQVTISKGFWMGKYEVTQEQYLAVMGNDPSHFAGATNPVDNVSWEMATAFCEQATVMTGVTVRLPTEAEWEYACRAGTTTSYHNGDSEIDLRRVGWYKENSGGKMHAVGEKLPNAWGLYDVHGNVWEWCADWYGPYPDEPVTDPTGPVSGKQKVLRGGSRYYSPHYCRAANRIHNHLSFRHDGSGFRVVVPQ